MSKAPFDEDSTGIVENLIGTESPDALVAVGKTLYFAGNDGVKGTSCGEATPLRRRLDFDGADLQPGLVGSSPDVITNVNGTVFFRGSDGSAGVEVFKSDGTEAGTVLAADVNPSGGSNPAQLTNVNGTLFFRANNGTEGNELWKTTGSGATQYVIRPGPLFADPNFLTDVNGRFSSAPTTAPAARSCGRRRSRPRHRRRPPPPSHRSRPR